LLRLRNLFRDDAEGAVDRRVTGVVLIIGPAADVVVVPPVVGARKTE